MRMMSVNTVAIAAALALSGTHIGAQNAGVPPAQAAGNSIVRALFAAPQASGQQAQDPSEIEIEGTIEVLIEDHPAGSIVHAFLETATERIRLRGRPDGAEFAGLTTGSRVRARGRRLQDGTLELKGGRPSGGGGTSTTDTSTDSGVTTVALASPNTFGQQRVIVIMVNFQDNTSAPYGWSHAHDVTFNQASNFFLENSYGQTSLTGDVAGWFTIPLSSSGCDYNTLASLADQAATGAGVNLANYARRVYAFPKNGCSWWGLGTVGGNPSRAWINGSYSLKVVAHELGHNFGDRHSNSQPCDLSGCTTVEYGHDRDMMGGVGRGHFNAYQKERLGWLNYGYSPPIQTVTGSGTYWIDSLITPGSGAKALRILKSSTSSGSTFYYVEARTQHGFDGSYVGGVLLSTGHSSNGNSSYQVDLDSLTSAFDAVLDPGQTFTDGGAGFSITTISADAAGAWVRIEYQGAPCTERTPTVSLSPGGTINVAPGSTTSFTLSVRNNDDASCAGARFGVGMDVPSGWTWTTDRASVDVAPGASASANVSVTAPASASGTVQVRGTATRTSTSGPSGSSSTAYLNVQTPITEIGVTLTITSGTQYTLTANVASGSHAVSGAAVSFEITAPNGTRTTLSGTTGSNGSVSVKFKPKPRDPKGTYLVAATASASGVSGTAHGSFVY